MLALLSTQALAAQSTQVAEVLNRAWVYDAVRLGLIDKELWPGGTLCYDEISSEGLGLSGAQLAELQNLRGQPVATRLAVLTKPQRARLASYEADLKLLKQAVDRGLIAGPRASERLCH